MSSQADLEWITPREWAQRVNRFSRADRFRVLESLDPSLASKRNVTVDDDVTFKAVGPDPPTGTRSSELVVCVAGMSIGRVSVGLYDRRGGGDADRLAQVAKAYNGQ